jgi:hypothetical protein
MKQVVHYCIPEEPTSTRRNDNPTTRFSIVSRFLDTATYLIAINVIYIVERWETSTLFTYFFLLLLFHLFLELKKIKQHSLRTERGGRKHATETNDQERKKRRKKKGGKLS